MNDYWTPQFKWQLTEWLSKYYKTSKSKFEKIKKSQLYTIYYNTRNKLLTTD